ncbi:MAG: peptidylprolyl isomerase [Chloroflexi bacterium]|nr:peptidylprolyl isomerase [Chloroflexota bacterium]
MKNLKTVVIMVLALVMAVITLSACSAPQAKNGDTVQINYTGKLSDGTVFDSSVGGTPLEFKLGAATVIPGFEKAVLGMKVGEKKTVTIPVNEAYGPRRDDLVEEISRDQLSKDLIPYVGQHLHSTNTEGATRDAVVTKVTDTTITVDENLPLAGKDLTFDLELIKIL